jgi:glycosyltransferase involved in cell wall biosynthesis
MISVILGVYNHLENLPRVVDGWNRQIRQDFELIMCDDGSTDGTEEWAKDKPFTYVRQPNKGMRLAKSINNGLKEAKGDYALFVMGDSIPNPDYLENMIPYLNENAVLCGVRENVTKELEHISWDWRYEGRETQLDWDFGVIRDMEWARITGNGMLIPMKLLKKVGGWPEAFEGYGADDNFLSVKLYAEGAVFLDTPKAILRHIEHKVSEDNPKSVEIFRTETIKMFDKLREKIKPQQITLTFDDFGPSNSNIYFLEKLKENYPNLKVTLFTVPESTQSGELISLLDKPDFCNHIRKYDWIELCPHGWHHPDISQGRQPEFMDISYYETTRYIESVETIFSEAKLPYQKIFKAPQYKLSEAGKNAFKDQGWTIAVSGTGEFWPSDLPLTTTNWNIRQELPLRKKVVSYGHIQDLGNGMLECWENLVKMPSDTKFKFLSEVVDEKIGLPPHL